MIDAAFHNTLDWTAIGTLALALVTALALVLGWLTLRQTKSEIEVSRREVEESHRPVLVALYDHRKMNLLGEGVPVEMSCQPYAHSDGVLTVPIENIGTGPALVVVATINLQSDDGSWGASAETRLGGLRADGRVPLLFEVDGVRGGSAPAYRLDMTYADVANTWRRTFDNFDASEKAYEGATITRGLIARPPDGGYEAWVRSRSLPRPA